MDSFAIRWKASEVIEKKHGAWLSLVRYKDTKEDLSSFIQEQGQKGHYITLSYFINGYDFVQYMNLNYFKRSILDTPSQLVNSLSFPWNQDKPINYRYEKLLLKRHLGQKISKREVEAAIDRMDSRLGEKSHELVDKIFQEEQLDVNLYGCCICRDRECGYFNIEVKESGQVMEWDLKIPYHRKYLFDKQTYYDAFAEYGQLLENKSRKSKTHA